MFYNISNISLWCYSDKKLFIGLHNSEVEPLKFPQIKKMNM